MSRHGIKVTAYSGFKANERPVDFLLDEEKIEIREILKQWRDPEHDCFRVMGSDNKQYVLKWDRRKDQWTVEKNREP